MLFGCIWKVIDLVVSQAPFEVEESGWGEFETQITIFFADPNEKPVRIYKSNLTQKCYPIYILGDVLSSLETLFNGY